MQNNLQRASFWKRIAAWMFDSIIVAIIAVGVAYLISLAFGYDTYSATVSASYEKYETEYGVDFDISAEAYAKLSDDDKSSYDAAHTALISDEEAVYAYSMMVNLSLIIVTLALLSGLLIWEFILPIIFGGGQTLGKKIFGLCLVKPNCVKINHLQLLVRVLLGKFTVETMIPVYVVMMLVFETLNLFGIIAVATIIVVQAVLLIVNENKSLIHDLLAGTVVCDAASTRIFESEEELIEYKKSCHAEEVNKKTY
jgi:uncharacterized RDD family membrane protein YckC